MRKEAKNKFEFAFVVSGTDPHSDDFEDVFYEAGCDDATLMLLKGSIVVKFTRRGYPSYLDAVISAYSNLIDAGVKIERFDPDFLVSQSEIAERAGITRSAVTNYVNEDRGVNFPAPSFRVMSKSPLWDWVDVSHWLYKNEQIEKSLFDDALISRGMNMFIHKSAPLTKVESSLHEALPA